MVIL
jgi:hypothetical protein